MTKPKIEVEQFVHRLCQNETVDRLLQWKERIREVAIKEGLNPDGDIGKLFISTIDTHIHVKQLEASESGCLV